MSIPQEELDKIPKVEEAYNSKNKDKIKIKKIISNQASLVEPDWPLNWDWSCEFEDGRKGNVYFKEDQKTKEIKDVSVKYH